MGIFRSRFFILILVTIMILVVIGITSDQESGFFKINNIMDVSLSPFQKVIHFFSNKIKSAALYVKDIKVLKQENEQLKLQIDQLEKENRELTEYRGKIKELRDALSIKDKFSDYEVVGANVVSKDPGNWFNIFRIDIGNRDGISISEKNSSYYPVMTSKGLVGRIIGTDVFSSRVMSIIDVDSTVSARLYKTRDLVIVKGDLTLKNQGLCKMDYIPPEVDIMVGDIIETSGMGGIFPKGIIIGRIKEVRQSNNELSRYAVIEPAVDFKRLEEVVVLKSKTIQPGIEK